ENGVERRTQLVRDGGEEFVLEAVDMFGLGARNRFLLIRGPYRLFGALSLGDVPRDSRHADNFAPGVPDRRQGQRNTDPASVLASAHSLEVLNVFAAPQALQIAILHC